MEKNIIELLIELRDYVLEKYPKEIWNSNGKSGLCFCIHSLHNLNIYYRNELSKYVYINRPNQDSVWGWKPGSAKPRLNWLNKRIEIETKKLNDERNRG